MSTKWRKRTSHMRNWYFDERFAPHQSSLTSLCEIIPVVWYCRFAPCQSSPPVLCKLLRLMNQICDVNKTNNVKVHVESVPSSAFICRISTCTVLVRTCTENWYLCNKLHTSRPHQSSLPSERCIFPKPP